MVFGKTWCAFTKGVIELFENNGMSEHYKLENLDEQIDAGQAM